MKKLAATLITLTAIGVAVKVAKKKEKNKRKIDLLHKKVLEEGNER